MFSKSLGFIDQNPFQIQFCLRSGCRRVHSLMLFSTGYAYYGEYPASFAACFENKEMYDYLIRRGADPNRKDTFGNTVLHLCVIHNKIVSKKSII